VAAWQDVLEEMIRLRRPALVGYAYLLTGNRSQAEDLVHDALVRTFSRARALTDVRSTEGYVRKAIATTFLNDIRSRRAFTSRQHLLVEPATDAVAVQVALEVLSRRERACIVLRFFEDFTVPEIARALGLADGSVKRYLSDAISRLERILGPTRGLSLDHGSDARIDVEITTRGTR
jgi:RNA polymerase sigma factor (sigma-70 family)